MNAKEQTAVCNLIIRHIEELSKLRDMMNTEAAKEAITAEMEFFHGILQKLPADD